MKCFVIMPFAQEFNDVYDTVVRAVTTSAKGVKVSCVRLDQIKGAGRISSDLARELQEATLCIADVSGNQPNVLWEVGYAMALGRPVILITQDLRALPFDIKDVRAVEYHKTSLAESLFNTLVESVRHTIEGGESYTSLQPPPFYVPEFATGMKEVIRQLDRTKRRLFIMCDFAGYAHFSELDLFQEYWTALNRAISRCSEVKILLYRPSLYRHARRRQFPHFERLRRSDNYSKFLCHRGLTDFKNIDAFMKKLDEMETGWRNELAKVADVQTRAGSFWMFQWLNETSHVVYSIQPTHDPNDEMVFQSHDGSLAQAMRDQFLEKLWPATVTKASRSQHARTGPVLAKRQREELSIDNRPLKRRIKMDPVTVISLISSGLGLVDKFVNLVRKMSSGTDRPHRVEAKQEGTELVVRRDQQVVERVDTSKLNLDQWDSVRYEALRQRVQTLWNQFNGLYGELPILSVDEQVRIKQRMETMKKELCKDFNEMVAISERVLGVPLGDHYMLYDTCSESIA